MTVDVETEIAVAPEVAFDKMADVRNEVHWNDQVTRSELVSPEPIRKGSRFKTVNRGNEYDALLTVYDRPRALAFEARGRQLDIDASFRFDATGSGATRFQGHFDIRPKGWFKIMFALITPMVRRDFPKQVGRFKALCEGALK